MRYSRIWRAPHYRLTTAEIIYHLPDHPGLLQTFVWQTMDIAPDFPALRAFLDFWERKIEGRLHSVTVAGAKVLDGGTWRAADAELRLQ